MHNKIAIIDTYVPPLAEMREGLAKYYTHIKVSSLSFLSKPCEPTNSHGVMSLFELTRPLWDIEVVCLETLNDRGMGTFADFYNALRWCARQDLDMVHTSSGFANLASYKVHRLQRLSRKLRKQGKVLTASAGNMEGGAVMYPASLDEWLAIGAKAAYASQGEEVMFSLVGEETASEGLNGPIKWDGTSRTAPEIAGIGYRILQELDKLPFTVEDAQEAMATVLCFLAKQPTRPTKWEILHHDALTGFGTLNWLSDLMRTQFDRWTEDNIAGGIE